MLISSLITHEINSHPYVLNSRVELIKNEISFNLRCRWHSQLKNFLWRHARKILFLLWAKVSVWVCFPINSLIISNDNYKCAQIPWLGRQGVAYHRHVIDIAILSLSIKAGQFSSTRKRHLLMIEQSIIILQLRLQLLHLFFILNIGKWQNFIASF